MPGDFVDASVIWFQQAWEVDHGIQACEFSSYMSWGKQTMLSVAYIDEHFDSHYFDIASQHKLSHSKQDTDQHRPWDA